MPRTYDPVIRDQARRLYVAEDKTIDEIATMLSPVPKATIMDWYRKEKWAEQKMVKSFRPWEVVSDLLYQIKMISDNARKDGRPLTPAEVDSIAKLTATVKRIEPGVNEVAYIMEGLERFSEYLKSNAPTATDALQLINLHMLSFIALISREKIRG